MANLEAKGKISVPQFGVILAATMLGAQVVSLPGQIVPQAEQLAWISVILGGGLFFGAAWLQLKLAALYPDRDFTDYLPELMGKWPGLGIIGLFLCLYFVVTWVTLQQFSRVLTFFMFDRTPGDVIIMTMLAVILYCVVQDLGTVVRVTEFTFLFSIGMLGLIWMTSIFNFQPDNLLPLWTDKPLSILTASLNTWGTYGGYEIILPLFPFISRRKQKLTVATGAAFVFTLVVSLLVVILTVGVITVEGVKNESYPTLVVVRSVELPGTFVERLENYLLIAWIPLIFNTLAVIVYSMSHTLSRLWGFADHRPWALALTPLLYLGATLLDGLDQVIVAGKVLTGAGVVFSLAIVPLVYLIARWRGKGAAGSGG